MQNIISDTIIKGKLQPGEHLIKMSWLNHLMRMPICEAMKQLAAEGYNTLKPHKGAIVKKFMICELEEIYFLRAKFE